MNKKQTTLYLQTILSIVIPFFIFIAHAVMFGNYIIDDAGISFAYSRSLAGGFGLVSQPGKLPVEGYSNFTWVLLMAPFFVIHAFDPIITPKIIGGLLTLATFILVHLILKRTTDHPFIGTAIVLTFLASNTSFVMWAVAGLENPLYVFFVTLLVYLTILNLKQTNTKRIIGIGIIAALCALSRPDGVLYSLVYPGITVLQWLFAKEKQPIKDIIKILTIYAAAFLSLFGGYAIFRYFYFHDFYPNTYWAKGGGLSFEPKEWYEKIRDLLKSLGLTRYTLAGFVGIVLFTLITKSVKKLEEWVILIALLISFAIYTLLPIDWMNEYRFATPFILLFFLSSCIILYRFSEKILPNKKASIAVFLLIFALWGIKSFPKYYQRTQVQAKDPLISFTHITETYAIPFNEYAEALEIEDGSLLVPDLGGTLYYSNLTLYDMPGLADKTIARTFNPDRDKFRDYIFDEVKPTFIHTHGIWTYKTRFSNDPRFIRDYVAIEAYNEKVNNDSDQDGSQEEFISGNFVRKDAIKDPQLLIDLQESLK
jgi:hypothetical protein